MFWTATGRAAALGVSVTLLVSGCAGHPLAFRVDNRLKIVAPQARSQVSLPVTVRWRIQDFDIVGPGGTAREGRAAGYFGLFVDRPPQPPGQSLGWLARSDTTCRPSEGCPDQAYFAARGVYSTTNTEYTFDRLPAPSDTNSKERHNVTIVLLDPAGVRIGENTFYVDFTVKRNSTG